MAGRIGVVSGRWEEMGTVEALTEEEGEVAIGAMGAMGVVAGATEGDEGRDEMWERA